jgi:hypothetical protein
VTRRYQIIGGNAVVTDFEGRKECPIVNPRGAIQSVWALGNLYEPPLDAYGVAPLCDRAGNGHALTGGGVGDYAYTAAGSTLNATLTTTDLAAAAGEATIIAVAKVPTAGNVALVGNWNGSAANAGVLLGVTAGTAKAYLFKGDNTNINPVLDADGACDVNWTMYALSVTRASCMIYRRRSNLNGGVASTATVTRVDAAIGGVIGLHIGNDPAFTAQGQSIAVVVTANRAYSRGELDQIYADLQAAQSAYAGMSF